MAPWITKIIKNVSILQNVCDFALSKLLKSRAQIAQILHFHVCSLIAQFQGKNTAAAMFGCKKSRRPKHFSQCKKCNYASNWCI